MTPLEELIRAAIDRLAHNRIALSSPDRDAITRAVVEVIPTADVTDTQIAAALGYEDYGYWWDEDGEYIAHAESDGYWRTYSIAADRTAKRLVATVRSLLNAQRASDTAAHAAEVEALRAKPTLSIKGRGAGRYHRLSKGWWVVALNTRTGAVAALTPGQFRHRYTEAPTP